MDPVLLAQLKALFRNYLVTKRNLDLARVEGNNLHDQLQYFAEYIPPRVAILRTWQNHLTDIERHNCIQNGVDLLVERFTTLINDRPPYHDWFYETVNTLTNLIPGFTFGHSQKWVSMLTKYLYCFNIVPDFDYSNCFCPIDSIIIEQIINHLEPTVADRAYLKTVRWSRIATLNDLTIFNNVLDGLLLPTEDTPLEFDLRYWQPQE